MGRWMGEKVEDRWEAGRQAMRQSLELSKVGQPEEALRVLDKAIAEANVGRNPLPSCRRFSSRDGRC